MKRIMQLIVLMVAGIGFFSGVVSAEDKASVDYAAECKKEAEGADDIEIYVKECIKQYEEIAKENSKKDS